MSSLRAEHGGAIAILLVLYALRVHYPLLSLPPTLDIWIDNSEVVRRGKLDTPKLGIKQQLTLDQDLWATTQRLLKALPCKIQWRWIKGHQTQGQGKKWKVEIEINHLCDKKAENSKI